MNGNTARYCKIAHGFGNAVDATLGIPDAAGKLHVCNDGQRGGRAVGAGSHIGGKAPQQLAEVG